jgi:diguanylate cyclase (GGDEF)-like protein/PAS domain S-box-containing protein
MTKIDTDIFRSLVDSSPQAVAMVDALNPDHPVTYVNRSLELLTGYGALELVGRNLRLLQGQDREQAGRHLLREALSRGETCQTVMRNYRKDGTLFQNEMSVLPLRDASGNISHFAGFLRDAAEKPRIDSRFARDAGPGAQAPAGTIVRDDRLTGLLTLPYLEGLLKRDWAIARREGRSIAIFAIDIDSLNLYNATFGRAAGDSAIRRVAHCISGCLRRASDAAARAEGGSFIAFAPGVNAEQALKLGQVIAERVREMRIHHPRCSVLRYISVSVGVSSSIPAQTETCESLLHKARQQLLAAKQSGRNQAA